MYCSKCGKQIPDNVRFCNYCGAKITGEQNAAPFEAVHSEPSGTASGPAPQAASYSASSAAPSGDKSPAAGKKKHNKWIAVLAVMVAFLLAREVIAPMLLKSKNQNSGPTSASSSPAYTYDFGNSQSSQGGTSAGGAGTGNGTGTAGSDELWDSNTCGALYQDGYFRYGPVCINIGYDYTLASYDDGTGERDCLVSADGNNILYIDSSYSAVSFSGLTQEVIRQSYMEAGYTDVSVLSLDSFTINDDPYGFKICHAKAPLDDMEDHYISQIIVFDNTTSISGTRLFVTMESAGEDAFNNAKSTLGGMTVGSRPVTASEVDILKGIRGITAK